MTVPKSNAEHYLEIYRRALPSAYVENLDLADDGIGMDLPAAMAKVFELADCASNRGTQATFLRPHSDQSDIPAAGPAKATGTLRITRKPALVGDLHLLAGTLFEAYRTDSFGREEILGTYSATHALTFLDPTFEGNPNPAAERALELEAQSTLAGHTGNLSLETVRFRFVEQSSFFVDVENIDMLTMEPFSGVFTDAQLGMHFVLEALPMDPEPPISVASPLEQIRRILTISPWDVTFPPHRITFEPLMDGADMERLFRVHLLTNRDLFEVEQVSDMAGGNGGALDDRGVEAMAPRLAGETDTEMTIRLENQQDAISPDAVVRAIDALLTPLGIAWRFLEVGDPQGLGGFVWDLHPWDFGTITHVTSNAEPYQVQGAVMLSESQTRRFFVVAVQDTIANAVASKLWQRINQIRARGVSFRLVIDPGL